MRINELRLHNFRMFEDLRIDLHEKLTVIVGKNGCGKTSVLEALAVSAGTLFYALPGVKNYGIKKSDVHYKYFTMGSVVDVQPQYPVGILAVGVVDKEEIDWERMLGSEEGKTTVGNAKHMTCYSKSCRSRLMHGDSTLVLPVVAYYGTGRLWDHRREKKGDTLKKNNRTNGYIDSLDGSANVKLMMRWFQKMALIDSLSKCPSPEFAAVRHAMERCFSMLTGTEKVEVQFNPDTQEIEITYEEDNQDYVRFPLSQMSDGYRCALSLIADIAYRMAVLNPQLSENVLTETDGIILIDEVDLHLHPAWQQRILGDLTSIFPKVQFIVTTHAPAVINSVRSENLVILENNDAREPFGQVYGRDINTIVKGIMGADERPASIQGKFKLFYQVLEEGKLDSAENILREIESDIGTDDAELGACHVKLKLKKYRR